MLCYGTCEAGTHLGVCSSSKSNTRLSTCSHCHLVVACNSLLLCRCSSYTWKHLLCISKLLLLLQCCQMALCHHLGRPLLLLLLVLPLPHTLLVAAGGGASAVAGGRGATTAAATATGTRQEGAKEVVVVGATQQQGELHTNIINNLSSNCREVLGLGTRCSSSCRAHLHRSRHHLAHPLCSSSSRRRLGNCPRPRLDSQYHSEGALHLHSSSCQTCLPALRR